MATGGWILRWVCFFFQAEDGIRDIGVTGVQTCALPIWLTSKAMQSQLGVDQPDYGVVFDSHVFENGATLSYADHVMIAPKVEAELAFVLEIGRASYRERV